MLRKKPKKAEETEREKIRQLVGFRIGEEFYGIEIHGIQEIDRMHSVTKLPKSLPFVEGVINLRGTVIPVVDMGRRLGLPRVEAGRLTRIIIARISGQAVGLVVEQVTEVLEIKEESIDPAPSMAFSVDTRYVEGVGRTEGGLVIILNLELLFSPEEMSALQAQPLP